MNKLMRFLAVVAMLIGMSTSSWALEFREIPENAKETVTRSVFFHDGAKKNNTVSVGLCQSGFYGLRTQGGRNVAEFLQPCVFGGIKTDGTDGVQGSVGVGLVEFMDVLSFNIGVLPDGNFTYGTGITVNTDNVLRLFE